MMNSYIFETIDYEKSFPAKVFITSIHNSNFHWHYEYELILVLKGSLSVNATPKPLILETGDILLINSKMVHSLKKTQEDNICLFIQLNQSLFNDWKNKKRDYYFYLNSKCTDLPPRKAYSEFIKIMANIAVEANKEDIAGYYRTKAWLFMLVADLFEFVHYDIRQFAAVSNENNGAQTLMEIITFVEEHFKEDNMVDSLCKRIGMSEKTIYRFLKQNVGITLMGLTNNYKIEHSKAMLKFTDKPINYIATECGFTSDITFYRIFKKEVGVTPNDYRQSDVALEKNQEVKGYLDYSKKEAVDLLEKYL